MTSRELMVIEYPGKVENVDNMMKTLGGITKTSKVFCGEQKRLELRYHYDNPYNKGVCSDSVPGYGLLLSVKVRRYKKKTRPPEFGVKILGHCNQIFTFKSLCDFQYLPLLKNPSTGLTCFGMNFLVPNSPTDLEYFSRSDAPLFIIPSSFARSDTIAPFSSIFKYDQNDDGQQEVLATSAKASFESQEFVSFSMTEPIPSQLDLQTLKRMRVKYVSEEQFQRVQKLFEECPIWTRIALLYESGVSNDKIKCIVPALAYYYTTGPWRMLYVRYGYDPRKHFESRHYQTFDFRMRYRSGISEFISVRKHILQKPHDNTEDEKMGALVQDVNYPYFDENKLPRSRQCILRYCDLHVSRIHEMLEKIPSPLAGAVCNEKTGWLPAGFDAQVRQIVCNAVKELLRKHNSKDKSSAELEYDENDDEIEDEESGMQSDYEAFGASEKLDSLENMDID